MNKKDSAKILSSILREKDLPLDQITRDALEVAVRCLKGQNGKINHRRDSNGRFARQINTYKINGDIIECYSDKGELLFFTNKIYESHIKKYSWGKLAEGYSAAYVSGQIISIHRYILKAPKNKLVDHINGNKKDNRKENLRLCNKSENAFNIPIKASNTSGHTGVWFRKDTKRWAAEIKVNGKKISLGCYEKFEDAIKARKDAEIQYVKEFIRKDEYQ